jgi:hypothetical protein
VLPDHRPSPVKIIGELLANHLEAASLLAEASHRRALAVCSAAVVRLKFNAAQAARLAYEELRHRLEPRRSHLVDYLAGLLLLLGLSATLAMLNLIEFSGFLGGLSSAFPALAATAVWLTAAWLAAVAVRRRRGIVVAAIIGAAVLLVALHGLGAHQGWPAVTGHACGSMVFAAVTGAFILVLTAGAASLVAHLEPASLLVARRRWYRARAAHEAAVATEHADAEAAAIATQAWLALVKTRAIAVAAGDEHLVRETVALARVILESARPDLPPAA